MTAGENWGSWLVTWARGVSKILEWTIFHSSGLSASLREGYELGLAHSGTSYKSPCMSY